MPPHSARFRALSAGLLSLALAAVAVGASSAPAAAAGTAATPASATVLAAASYATTTFHDEWDYSNSADLLIDNSGPSMHVANPSWSGGVFSYTAEPGSYVSPLWGGYPGSLYMDRDGGLPANHITASEYDHLSIHAYSSAEISSAVQWFDSPQLGNSTEGGYAFRLEPGWHEYDIPLSKNMFPVLKVDWAGTIEGIRFATSPTANATIKLDDMRLYKAGAEAAASWNIVGGVAQPYWSSNGATSCAAASQTCGAVQDASGQAIGAATGVLTVDASAYPAGTTLFLATPGTATGIPGSAIHIAPRPQPIVDSPAAAGCGDFATSTYGHQWLASAATVSVKNATGVSLSGGRLTATNTNNDPEVWFGAGHGIDAAVWRYLSVTESYTGAFNLLNEPGGGTMARALWSTPGRPLSQSQDLLTYQDRPTLTVDLGMPAATLTENTAAVRYGWGGTIAALRWDPNEDPGKRNWTLSKATLGRECATGSGGFAVTWHDPGWVSGTTAVVEAVPTSGAAARVLATVAETSGENSFTVPQTTAPLGDYSIRVVSHSPLAGATGSAASATPLRITPTTNREAGADRYATSVQVSKSAFPNGSRTVLLASGANYPDALSAAPAAAAQKGTLLLTGSRSLPASVASELKRLKPASVYLIGGSSAISSAVASRVKSVTGVSPVRVAGADRYATSAAVAARFFSGTGGKAFVATGAGFPDALSAASAAARLDAPVLLVPGTGTSPTTGVTKQLSRLRPAAIYAVGGTAVVSAAMLTRLARTATTTRLAGANRYGTSVAVGKAFDAGGSAAALLASGLNFPDALVGASLANARSAPLYLTEPACLPSTTRGELARLGATSLTLIGGSTVLATTLDEADC